MAFLYKYAYIVYVDLCVGVRAHNMCTYIHTYVFISDILYLYVMNYTRTWCIAVLSSYTYSRNVHAMIKSD